MPSSGDRLALFESWLGVFLADRHHQEAQFLIIEPVGAEAYMQLAWEGDIYAEVSGTGSAPYVLPTPRHEALLALGFHAPDEAGNLGDANYWRYWEAATDANEIALAVDAVFTTVHPWPTGAQFAVQAEMPKDFVVDTNPPRRASTMPVRVPSIRDPIPAQLRFRVLQRDAFRCQYCGQAARDGAQLHVDHVVPVAAGGATEEGNLITACEQCNLGKSDRPVV